MSLPNRTIDASPPCAQALARREPIEDRRVLTSRVHSPVAVEPPTSRRERVSAVEAMALCMSDGCIGG